MTADRRAWALPILLLAALVLLGPGPTLADEKASETARVVAANEAFYTAFRRPDMTAMEAIWSKDAHASVIHPGRAGIRGRAAVMKSWRAILSGNAPRIGALRPKVTVVGTAAYGICDQQLSGGVLNATSIFVEENGAWRMIHHHAGPTTAKPREAILTRRKGARYTGRAQARTGG